MTVRYHAPPRHARARLPMHRRLDPGRPAALPGRSPAPASMPRSASFCSTPSPRSRSRSRSPSKPSSKRAPTTPTGSRASHVERARQRAELARRRYLAVDPDNRLVADTLEADWNDALRAHQAAQDDYERASHPPPTPRSTMTPKARIRQLAADFPALWADPDTPQRERKRIARLLIEDVTLTQHRPDPPPRPLPRRTHHQPHPPDRRRTPGRPARPTPTRSPQLDRLLDDHTDADTAAAAQPAGHRSGTDQPFTARIVLELRRDHGFPSHAERLRARGLLTPTEIADRLAVHTNHDQRLAARRPAHLPQGQRQERAALRAARARRPQARQTAAAGGSTIQTRTHPINPKRCTMKPTPLLCGSAGSHVWIDKP